MSHATQSHATEPKNSSNGKEDNANQNRINDGSNYSYPESAVSNARLNSGISGDGCVASRWNTRWNGGNSRSIRSAAAAAERRAGWIWSSTLCAE